MPFKPKNPALLSEQYKNIDELVCLTTEERSVRLRLEAIRERKQHLRRRNTEICYVNRPASRRDESYEDFAKKIRAESEYPSAA